MDEFRLYSTAKLDQFDLPELEAKRERATAILKRLQCSPPTGEVVGSICYYRSTVLQRLNEEIGKRLREAGAAEERSESAPASQEKTNGHPNGHVQRVNVKDLQIICAIQAEKLACECPSYSRFQHATPPPPSKIGKPRTKQHAAHTKLPRHFSHKR